MIFLAVHNGQPKELPLDKAIRAFLDHRTEVVRRRTAFLLNKAREREHILLGYQIALDHLDTVIKIIRQSASRVAARENLFNYFSNRRINLNGTELAGVTLDPTKYAIDLLGGSADRPRGKWPVGPRVQIGHSLKDGELGAQSRWLHKPREYPHVHRRSAGPAVAALAGAFRARGHDALHALGR